MYYILIVFSQSAFPVGEQLKATTVMNEMPIRDQN
jgi:hypothetical protein